MRDDGGKWVRRDSLGGPPEAGQRGQCVTANVGEVGLVDEGGGLERLARLLVGHSRGRDLAQLAVDERKDVGGHLTVAGGRGVGQAGQVAHCQPSLAARHRTIKREPAFSLDLRPPAQPAPVRPPRGQLNLPRAMKLEEDAPQSSRWTR